MDKIVISPSSHDGAVGAKRLLPIVEYCVERGAKLSDSSIEKPFRSTPNGGFCLITSSVSLKDIQAAFSLPQDIIVGVPYPNCLWDKTHNNAICFEG